MLRRPELLSEELDEFGEGDTVIIDEIQKLPELLDEVHSLIQRKGIRFILSGSSARKLKRLGTNLLGGRADLPAGGEVVRGLHQLRGNLHGNA